MAKVIKSGWELEIVEVEGGRYLVKLFRRKESGILFSEVEYRKRTRTA